LESKLNRVSSVTNGYFAENSRKKNSSVASTRI
jgi:hypothetical protein